MQDPYFPHGNVDLHYALECTAEDDGSEAGSASNGSTGRGIRLLTNRRSYHLVADTDASRDDWVKAIQKAIFRTQHEGESVKVRCSFFFVVQLLSPVRTRGRGDWGSLSCRHATLCHARSFLSIHLTLSLMAPLYPSPSLAFPLRLPFHSRPSPRSTSLRRSILPTHSRLKSSKVLRPPARRSRSTHTSLPTLSTSRLPS